MEQEKDIRFFKTDKLIIDGFTRLLKEKNFEDITVKNICEYAEISRSGFYLHYQDKYDLVEKYQMNLINYANSLFQSVPETHLKKEDLMVNILHYLKEEGQLLALLISDHGSTDIQNQIKEIIKKNALVNVLPYINLSIESEQEKNYFVAFFSNAIFGILQEWINNGQQESPEYIVGVINKIVKFDLV